MTKAAYVYILASKKNGTLYTGVTNNLECRMYQHKYHLLDGFTDKYNVTRLVWFTQGASLVKDTLQVCAKNASDVYGWRTLY